MRIRCWGARGSIPVSGREYIRYGGDTTCIEIRTETGDILIVDAGSGIRRLGNLLMAEGCPAFTMLFTHAHWDHLMGFPFFKPVYRPDTRIDVYGCPFAESSLRELISRIMAPPHFPVAFEEIRASIVFASTCEEAFRIGGLDVTSIPLSHPNEGQGYRFAENGRSFVFLTDNELGFRHPGGRSFEDYVRFAGDADLLIHDAEYRPSEYQHTVEWGHSTFSDAVRLGLDAGARRMGLFHHNQDRSDVEVDVMVREAQGIVEERRGRLDCFAVSQDMELAV